MSSTRTVAAYKGHQTRLERDSLARANLPADLLPLWEQTRSQFKGDAHSRVEQFLEYVEENPGEDVQALQASADAKLDALIEARLAA